MDVTKQGKLAGQLRGRGGCLVTLMTLGGDKLTRVRVRVELRLFLLCAIDTIIEELSLSLSRLLLPADQL